MLLIIENSVDSTSRGSVLLTYHRELSWIFGKNHFIKFNTCCFNFQPLSLEKARGEVVAYRITICGNFEQTIPATQNMSHFEVNLTNMITPCQILFEVGNKFPYNNTIRFNNTLRPAAITLPALAKGELHNISPLSLGCLSNSE